MNNMNNDTYTLWNEGTLLWKGEHTRATFDEMLEEAYDLDGTVEIYSSRDDLVWSSYGDEPNEPSDAWLKGFSWKISWLHERSPARFATSTQPATTANGQL